MLDDHAAKIFNDNINLMVPWYIMASFAYYKKDDPIFSDSFYDDLAKTMLAVWNDIEHFHKHYITKDMLAGGTYLGEYPSRVEGALKSVREIYYTKSGKIKKNPKKPKIRG